MALIVDARRNPNQRFRLWDTQTGGYVTDERTHEEMLSTVRQMLRGSGIGDGPDVAAAINVWLADAVRRGTNDPKQKADPDAARPWRDGRPPEGEPGDLRVALRARILAEQVARTVFDGRVLDWTESLTPAARALLTNAFVLHELLRGPGVATLRVERDRMLATVPTIKEIATVWADVVTVETDIPPKDEPLTVVFRLR